MSVKFLCLLLLGLGVSGCASYHPQPLPAAPSLAPDPARLQITLTPSPIPGLAPHRFDPADGLDITEVAMLAVANNPGLKAVRDQRQEAKAQMLTAGLLPNPQLSAGLDHPTGGDPGLMNAENLGLSYDLGSLVSRSATLDAARAKARQVDLSVLWQEWQVVQKARLLFIKISGQEKLNHQLQAYHCLLTDRYQRTAQALAAGDTTAEAASISLAELQALQTRIADLARQESQSRHELNAILGLAPEARLDLTGGADLSTLSAEEIAAALKRLPQRRPDLLALRAGYQSQEEQVRQEVLAQFPALNVGLSRARDTSGINTNGLAVTLTLPLFDRNQGHIAQAQATRKRLKDEYQARLDTAYGEAGMVKDQIVLLKRQLKETEAAIPPLARTVAQAKATLKDGDLDFTAYAALDAALFEKRLEALALDQSLDEQQATLQTLLGIDFKGRFEGQGAGLKVKDDEIDHK